MNANDFDISKMMFQLFDHTAEAILIVNNEGRILYANHATTTHGNKTVEEIPGNLLWEVYPASVGFSEEEFYTAVREKVPRTVEFHFPPTDKWFDVRLYPSANAIAIFFSDISERKRGEERHIQIASIVESSDDAIISKDLQGVILSWNTGAERLFGYTAQEAIGQHIEMLLPPERFDEEPEILSRIIRGERINHYETARRRKDGTLIDVSLTVSPISDSHSQIVGASKIARDITGRVRREQEMTAMNEALLISGVRQQEMTAIAQDLNTRLRRSMQETHHRVKNNLQVISSLVEIHTSDVENEVLTVPLQRIQQHIQALTSIHELLTQQATIDGDMDHLGTQSVLTALLPLLRSTIGDRNIIAHTDDIILTAQKVASFALLVSECVSNAVKHSKGEIEITLKMEGDKALLEICDDGDGFPSDFDPRKAANTGLQLIESTARWDLRGDVRYDNHGKGGGRVTVTFPVDPYALPPVLAAVSTLSEREFKPSSPAPLLQTQ